MAEDSQIYRSVIARKKLPQDFPTHIHAAQFWEELGRTIGTFGYLEDALTRAVFAFTATRQYSEDEIHEAYERWVKQLKKAMTDTLWNLGETYARAVKDNPKATITNVDDLVAAIKRVTVWRNILCHASWRSPDKDGASIPHFVNKRHEVVETAVSVETLREIRFETAALICDVVDTVTRMGYIFPGGTGAGQPIFEKK